MRADDVTVTAMVCQRWGPVFPGVRCDVNLCLHANNISLDNASKADIDVSKSHLLKSPQTHGLPECIDHPCTSFMWHSRRKEEDLFCLIHSDCILESLDEIGKFDLFQAVVIYQSCLNQNHLRLIGQSQGVCLQT